MRLDLARDEVSGDDAAGLAVDDDDLEHLVPGVHLDRLGRDLALEGLVGADEQLLPAGIEGARDLDAAEGAVVEQPAVLTSERDALGDALVDDVGADLGEAIDVGLARAVVAALDRVVEESVDGVAVLLVVLRRVDAALRGDRVGAARGVLVAEGLHVVARLAERGSGRATCEAGADDDDGELAPVDRVDERRLELAGVPPLGDRTARCLAVDERLALAIDAVDETTGVAGIGIGVGGLDCRSLRRDGVDGDADGVGGRGSRGVQVGHADQPFTSPKRMASGGRMKPTLTTSAVTVATVLAVARDRADVAQPRVCEALHTPCHRCRPRAIIASR